jgi:hypothetical protein
LGLPLPPVLHALYATVGNGGFGPAYGLVGITGGAPSVYVSPDSIEELEDEKTFAKTLYFTDDFHSSPARDSVVDSLENLPIDQLQAYRAAAPKKRRKRPKKDRTLAATLSRTDWRLSEHVTQALKQEPGRYLECETVPDGLVTLCHWGCGIYSHLYLQTGHIYVLSTVRRHGFVGEPWDVAPEDCAIGVEYQADSAEEWLDQWLRGELGQGGPQKVMLLSEIMDT